MYHIWETLYRICTLLIFCVLHHKSVCQIVYYLTNPFNFTEDIDIFPIFPLFGITGMMLRHACFLALIIHIMKQVIDIH